MNVTMKKINWKKTLPLVLSFSALLVMSVSTAVVASVQFTQADQKRWFTGSRVQVSERSPIEYNETNNDQLYSVGCAVIDNTGSESIFVPTKLNREWGAFGVGKPSDVGIFNCPLNGICGTADATNTLNNPNTGSERCSDGLYSSTDSVGSDGTYNWNCNGQFGGTNASCSANRIVNGSCGADNGGLFYNTPTNLCNSGNPSSVSGGSGSNFSWTCNGSNTGSTASCSATYQSTGPYTLGPWGGCSTNCGTGVQTRTVTCNFDSCTGESNSSRACTEGSNTCGWTSYGSYGSCSTSCGNGSRYRTRTCTTGAPGSAHCVGSATQATSCSAGSSTCGWGGFGGWGACSNTCGSGTQYRYRSCNVAGYCSGSTSESRACSSTAGCAGCTFLRPYAWPVQTGATQAGSCVEGASTHSPMVHGQTIGFSAQRCTNNGNGLQVYTCVGAGSVTCTNGVKTFSNDSCRGQAGQIQ